MKMIQMTLDDDLVAEVDNIVKKLKTTRSAFARKALKDAIKQANITMLEKNIKKVMSVVLSAKWNLASGNQSRDGAINGIFALPPYGEYLMKFSQ